MITISFKDNLHSLCSPDYIEILKRSVLFCFGIFFPKKHFIPKIRSSWRTQMNPFWVWWVLLDKSIGW